MHVPVEAVVLGSAEQDEEPETDDHDQSGTEQRGGEAERGGDEFAHDPPDRQSSLSRSSHTVVDTVPFPELGIAPRPRTPRSPS
ncbi:MULTISPECIES: hypothetical protein [unclassified Streptomyces]|uniref:hypothetical protein n=1 Tax=unclassified Streptomyces TaxID=2593676 RepID=UPI003245F130